MKLSLISWQMGYFHLLNATVMKEENFGIGQIRTPSRALSFSKFGNLSKH